MQAGVVNGDGVAMDVEPGGDTSPSRDHTHSENHQQTSPTNFELDTDQIKKLLAFGKDLQALYNSLTQHASNDKFKVLLQVIHCCSADVVCKDRLVFSSRIPSAC